MQVLADQVVSALGGITHSINSVRDYIASTAAAVEQQRVVTQELSSRMQTAATSVGAINDNMCEISSSVHQVMQAVGDTKPLPGCWSGRPRAKSDHSGSYPAAVK